MATVCAKLCGVTTSICHCQQCQPQMYYIVHFTTVHAKFRHLLDEPKECLTRDHAEYILKLYGDEFDAYGHIEESKHSLDDLARMEQEYLKECEEIEAQRWAQLESQQ